MSNIIVLGIAGGSGSGKTTLMKNLIARFQDDVTVLSHDNYYRPYDELTIEERRKLNYDHPDAFDTDMMIGHLKELKAGHSIECPVYDYATYSRTSETVTVEPRKVILVEGILIFENHALCDQMDIKIFVETDADVRILRRALRIRTPTSASSAASAATLQSAGEASIPCLASILQRSSPCTSSSLSRAKKMLILSCSRAARIWSRSK